MSATYVRTTITVDPYAIPDEDTLKRAADETLTRPGEAAFWDDRMYTTHGPVYGVAVNADDDLAESNFVILAANLGIRGDITPGGYYVLPDAGDENDDETAFVARVRHWAVGPVLQIWVQVYADEPHDWADYANLSDADTAYLAPYSPAFVAAVQAAETIREYAILDESDYSAREWDSFERALDLAWHDAWTDFERGTLWQIDRDDLDPALIAYIQNHALDAYDGGGGYGTDGAFHAANLDAIHAALSAIGPAIPAGHPTLLD